MILREYQEQAVNAVFKEWEDHQSTLLVLPTGTGKTVCFSEILKRVAPERGLVLAHREELIFQAKKHISDIGLDCDIEMGSLKAETRQFFGAADVVVSTIQTQVAGNNGNGRMAMFDPFDFGVLIADEAHHATSPTWRKTIEYYKQNPNLKILGVTATPDRADEEALGQVFESVAYDYEILDAINDGYLVPVEQQMVTIEGLDFSQIRTTAGDLNGADLASVMEAEKNMQGIAGSSIEIIGDKKALIFTASVKQAEMLAEIFNRHRSDMAGWAHGGTPREDRRRLLQQFADGSRQVVVNCGLFGEGFDEPTIEVVVQARPTKSRCLYAQQIGRGTRPLPGVVKTSHSAAGRKAAISESAKPTLLVVDFAGNSGKHKLITTADILGGKVSDDVIEAAKKRAAKSGKPVRMDQAITEIDALMQAEAEKKRQREAARKAHLVAKAEFSLRSINPFDIFQIQPVKERGWDRGKALSEKQRTLLLKQGINPDGMPYGQAAQLIREMFNRWDKKLCTLKQAKILRQRGIDTREVTAEGASKMIDDIAQREGWRKRG